MMGKKLIDYQHVFNYQLKLNSSLEGISTKTSPRGCGIANLKSKNRSTEFKFDIGFGKIKYEVDYITIKSLAKINEYLTKTFDHESFEEEDSKVVVEYFSEKANSLNSSKESKGDEELDESDDFVLITSSDNFGDANIRDFQHSKTEVPKPAPEPSPMKRMQGEEEYKFDSNALFKNKVPSSKRKVKYQFNQEEKHRKRLNSDTTACSRVKNILGQLKLPDTSMNKPEVFEKKQFEFKN